MEMDTQATPTPAPAPAPTPAPVPQAVAPVNTSSDSGSESGGGSITETFKNLNYIQIGFGILGAAALYYAIYYFRYNIQMNKTFVKNVENSIDDLTIKIADVSSVVNKQQQQKQQQDLGVFV